MPSFLADDGEPVFAVPGSGGTPYDPPGALPLRLSHELVNGHIHAKPPGEPFSADPYRVKRVDSMNTDGPTDDDPSSIINGTGSSWDGMSSRNGTASSTTNSYVNGVNGLSDTSTQTSPDHDAHGGREHDTHGLTNGYSAPIYAEPPMPKAPPPPPPPTEGLLNGLPPSILPVPTEVQSLPTTPLPQRFPSPPAMPPPPPPMSSTPGAASTAPVHPGAAQLKQRHTLQVPKASSSRNSKDGDDVVLASGRFSPTSVPASARRASLSLNRRNTRSIHSDLLHDEIPQDDEAARWAEAIRQKRASKRRRKEDEDEDRVVVGTKVDQNHVNWVTAYNMLTGIRFTVSRTNAKLDRALTDADFEARHKFSFDITGNELTPSAKYDFKFKDYAPWVFRSLRAKFGLDPADYLVSLTSKYILSELGSPGKSGSFFYFSRDYKYIIKTIHHAEHKFLRKILRDYYQHVEENPNTLLSQFYGLHRVKIPYGRKIHFVVMNNLFPPHRDIHQTFDLKGSTVGRDYKEENLEKNPRATLKDLNWMRRNLHLEFGPEKKRLFLEQMERDVRLLQRLKIMDYSMLVGVHDMEKGNKDNLRDKTLQVFQPGGEAALDDQTVQASLKRTQSKLENERKARELRQIIKQERPIPIEQTGNRMPDSLTDSVNKASVFYQDDGGFQATHEDNLPGEEIYYLGIIDCLTHYGMVKKLENFWKGLSHDSTQISPVPAEPYGTRFMNFISSITMSVEEADRTAQAAAGSEKPPETTRKRSGSQHLSNPAEESPAESSRHSQHDHVLTTIPAHAGDRADMSTILPVVEEQREGSTSSAQDRDLDGAAESKMLPTTPPKDSPPSSLSQAVQRAHSTKELPPLPHELANEKPTVTA